MLDDYSESNKRLRETPIMSTGKAKLPNMSVISLAMPSKIPILTIKILTIKMLNEYIYRE